MSRTVQAELTDLQFKSMITSDLDKDIRQHEIEYINKFSLALVCIIFFFIGAPLGAIIRKGGLGIRLLPQLVLEGLELAFLAAGAGGEAGKLGFKILQVFLDRRGQELDLLGFLGAAQDLVLRFAEAALDGGDLKLGLRGERGGFGRLLAKGLGAGGERFAFARRESVLARVSTPALLAAEPPVMLPPAFMTCPSSVTMRTRLPLARAMGTAWSSVSQITVRPRAFSTTARYCASQETRLEAMAMKPGWRWQTVSCSVWGRMVVRGRKVARPPSRRLSIWMAALPSSSEETTIFCMAAPSAVSMAVV